MMGLRSETEGKALLTIKEAAKFLGVGKTTFINNYLKTKKIGVVLVGKWYKIPREKLELFISENYQYYQ